METYYLSPSSLLRYLRLSVTLSILSILAVYNLAAQTLSENEEESSVIRPQETDKTSKELINNYLVASGGKQIHEAVENIVAYGTIREAKKLRNFRLVETSDGKRHLSYSWKLLGKEYLEVYAFDGSESWQQKVLPKEQPPVVTNDLSATHFKSHRWFIYPFTGPAYADFTFQYEGRGRVLGRSCYTIVGFGPQDERTWFYFDRAKFLVTQWGGIGPIGSTKDYLDYRAVKFEAADGILFPKEIQLLAENSPYGSINVESIRVNQVIKPDLFTRPPSKVPVIRIKKTE